MSTAYALTEIGELYDRVLQRFRLVVLGRHGHALCVL